MPVVSCDYCGKGFHKIPAEIARTKGNFCSRQCSANRKKKQSIDRFYAKTIEANGCWEWQGYINKHGYGVQRYKGKARLAHRVSYEISKGAINDKHVLHSCDNPSCVNPAHLFLGSHQDNMDDMTRKGRRFAKLTPKDIIDIKSSDKSSIELSKVFGVSERTIRKVKQPAPPTGKGE